MIVAQLGLRPAVTFPREAFQLVPLRDIPPSYHTAVSKPATTTPATQAQSVRERVEHVLSLIRPAVQLDGGDVELVEVTPEGIVRVRFHGACVGCPSSAMTLHSGIERNLKAQVSEVTAVEAIDCH